MWNREISCDQSKMEGLSSNITLLPDELLSYIAKHLNIDDRIAFASSCCRFRQVCLHNQCVFRKADFSKCTVRSQKDPLTKEFFRDKLMAQNIRELNFSNYRFQNWQMDVQLEEFINTCCPQLEALHVLNCGMSLKSLHCILQQATKLSVLSFSILDLSQEDMQFILYHREHDKGIFLENIKSLHVEILLTAIHLHVVKYLLLNCCKYLEDLEIYLWGLSNMFEIEDIYSGFLEHQLSAEKTEEPLQNFHSLTLQLSDTDHPNLEIASEIADFVISVIKKKSCRTKWKKLWISSRMESVDLQDRHGDISSVEVLSTISFQSDSLDDLFQRISDGVVRKLQVQFSESVARIGGDALQCLSLTRISHTYNMDENIALNALFSSCCNITELDLLHCHFQNNICESLCNLKQLVKLRVRLCAFALNGIEDHSNYQGNKKLLSLVENCPDVTVLIVHGCESSECLHSRSTIDDNDLSPLAMWTKLESFTCVRMYISHPYFGQYPKIKSTQDSIKFLEEMIENCKLLTMLRIEIGQDYLLRGFDITSFLQSGKSGQLKHLVIGVDIYWESDNFWKVLSCAKNLERLCVKNSQTGYINVPAVVDMLRSLTRLRVFHTHFESIANVQPCYKCIVELFEEEKSDRFAGFEFLMQRVEDEVALESWVYKKVLPINISELCSYYVPSIGLPKI